METSRSARSPGRGELALVAFCSHHPGVRLLYGLVQSPRLRRLDAWALAVSLVAALLAGVAVRGWLVAGLVFAVGHLSWGGLYAALLWRYGLDLFTAASRGGR